MAKRTKGSQSRHVAEVQRIARKFDREGYKVQADISGVPQPKTIGGYRPDVIATKGRERKIVEVETTESVNSARDRAQQKAFREAAKRSVNTTFRRTVVPTGD